MSSANVPCKRSKTPGQFIQQCNWTANLFVVFDRLYFTTESCPSLDRFRLIMRRQVLIRLKPKCIGQKCPQRVALLREKKLSSCSSPSLTKRSLSLYFYPVRCSFLFFHFNLLSFKRSNW